MSFISPSADARRSSSARSTSGRSSSLPFPFNPKRPRALYLPSPTSATSVGSPGSNIGSPSIAPSPRYPSFSVAASNAGSTNQLSSSPSVYSPRSKRSQVLNRFNPIREGVEVKVVHPDSIDLLLLDDPDEVFRMFPVREVRGLEERAKAAAGAKVSELRTMVGERYRDLLSAADSIVRMKVASEKLVDRLQHVDAGLAMSDLDHSLPRKSRMNQPRATIYKEIEPARHLDSAPTLSLTIQLLLSIPSHVHALLETSSFLPAARLEGVAKATYQVLDGHDSENEGERSLKEKFPIIERQWESIASLGSVIVRRATAELRVWDASASMIAQTLAAIVMLDNTPLKSALGLLLNARSKSLAKVLDPLIVGSSGKSTQAREVDSVVRHLVQAIDVVLHTSQAAEEIFGSTQSSGLLLQLFDEIENPSSGIDSSRRLSPILSTLPNYPLLTRFLPPSILDFSPSITSSHGGVSPTDASTQIAAWRTRSTQELIEGVQLWIADLHGGARTLARIRSAVHERLLRGGDVAADLEQQLETTIEARLESVYRHHLSTLVVRFSSCLSTLLDQLDASPADLDPAYFLFEMSLPFPSTSTSGMSSSSIAVSPPTRKPRDPFAVFAEALRKRVAGRTPLADRGLEELEAQAQDLKEDFRSWLTSDGSEAESRSNLRDQYVRSVKVTFDDIYEAISSCLDTVSNDVNRSLFVGNFASMLISSQSFSNDLLLGGSPHSNSQESEILQLWTTRLAELQSRSLVAWRISSISNAVAMLLKRTYPSHTTLLDQDIPAVTAPSACVLAALRVLVVSANKIGPQRIHRDPSIISELLCEFEGKAIEIYMGGMEELDSHVKIEQLVWDAVFLQQFAKEENGWNELVEKLVDLSKGSIDRSLISMSTLHYLQRTQTLFSPLFVPGSNASRSAVDAGETVGSRAWLHLGLVPASTTEFKSNLGMAKPGARLGLLPTRG